VAPILSSLERRVRRSGPNPVRVRTDPVWRPSLFRTSKGGELAEDEARTIPAVGRAVKIIAGTIAGFPLHMFEGDDLEMQQRVALPPELEALADPNPEFPPFVFYRVLLAHKVLREEAFVWVGKDNGGRRFRHPNGPGGGPGSGDLWPIHPRRMRVGRLEDGTKVYELDGKEAFLDFAAGGEIIHIIGESEDGLRGKGPLEYHASEFELALDAQEFAARHFSDSAHPSGLLSVPQDLDAGEAEELKRRWESQNQGLGKSGRLAVLGKGATWNPVSFNPQETQMIESRKYSKGEIATIFGVPPHLLADVERQTSWGTGVEEMGLQFRQFTLLDHMMPVEQTLTKVFLSGRPGPSRRLLFNADAVLRPDTLKRYQAHRIAVGGPFMTPNEARAKENLSAIDGGDKLGAAPNASGVTPPGAGSSEAPPEPPAEDSEAEDDSTEE
jgi:HK97 family phage portal protein